MLRIPTINRAPDESGGSSGDGEAEASQPQEKGKPQPQQADPAQSEKQQIQANADQYRGLIDKNKELLDEVKNTKRQLGSLLDELGGEEGVEEIRSLRKKASENEEFALMQQGRADVLRERWVKQTQREYERKLNSLQTYAKEKEAGIQVLQQKLQREIIGNAVRSAASKIKEFAETATDDAVIIALRVFALDESGAVIGKDENGSELYGKDGKLMSIREWLETQVDTRPHWFYSEGGMGMRPMGALSRVITMSRAAARTDPIAFAKQRREAEKSGKEVVVIE